MDHLPAPAGTEPIQIPYIPAQPYDGGPFLGYPERQNWKKKPSGELDFELTFDYASNSSDKGDEENEGNEGSVEDEDEKIDIFVQTWLYFGCLIEVFDIVGIHVEQDEFIRRGNFITTEKLPALIDDWRTRELSAKEGFALLNQKHIPRDSLWESKARSKLGRHGLIVAVLDTVQSYTRKYCYEGDIEIYGPNVPSWTVPSEICLSIMALGWTLKTAAHHIYQPQVPLPLQRWGTSPELTDRVRKAGWCFGEVAKLMSDSEIDCLYYFGSLKSPRSDQDHESCTEMGCSGHGIKGPYVTQHVVPTCNCSFVKVPVDQIVDIIKEGSVPLISWTKSSGLKVVKSDPQTRQSYLAISHVWSDGMGNENDNALPECQISRLLDMINGSYADQRPNEHKKRMFGPAVFLDGDGPVEKPVGFWIDTLCIPVQEENKLFRKMAIRQMKKIYEEAHRVLVVDSWVRELPRSASIREKATRLYLSNWQHRLWTLQEGVFAQGLFFQFQDGSQTLDDLWKEQKIDQETCPGFYSTIVRQTLPHVPITNFDLKDEKSVGRGEMFSHLLNGIANRKTGKWEDETICIATLLGLDTKFLLDVPNQLRMKNFLQKVGSFQQAIIFNELPRLMSQGFQWAPSSFITQSQSLWPRLKADLSEKYRKSHSEYRNLHSDGGLQVRFPGFILRRFGWSAQKKMMLIQRIAHNGKRIKFGVLLVDWNENLPFNPSLDYAIVSSIPVKPGLESACIFGSILGTDPAGVLIVQHQCLARAKVLNRKSLGKTPEVQSSLALYGTYFDGDVQDYDVVPIGVDIMPVTQEWRIV